MHLSLKPVESYGTETITYSNNISVIILSSKEMSVHLHSSKELHSHFFSTWWGHSFSFCISVENCQLRPLLVFFITSIASSTACTYCQQRITFFNVNKDCIHRQDILFAKGSNLSWGTENKLNNVNRRLYVYLAYTEINRLKTKKYYEQLFSPEDQRSFL